MCGYSFTLSTGGGTDLPPGAGMPQDPGYPTSVRLLLKYAASISRIFIYGKNSDGCDNNIVLLLVVTTCAQIVLGCLWSNDNILQVHTHFM